jgi:NTP pyrophosphatase (non-canonical NTP hydrolase)
MNSNISIRDYSDFVDAVTSSPSKDINVFVERIQELNSQSDVNIPRLMTGADGICSEAGEFMEIVKKILFQGKPLNEDNVFHMKRELGDIIFYWINACISLNLDPMDVIQENFNKLSARYPDGFTVARSEKRAVGDI